MIPDAATILAGHRFIARRHDLPPASALAVQAAVDAARACVTSASDEPVAVFFAFSAFPRCFPGAWRMMTTLLTINQARALGLRLHAGPDELHELMISVAARRSDFAAVREWFSTRLRRIE